MQNIGMRRWLWLNGLSLALFVGFLIFLVLQSIFGWPVHHEEQALTQGAAPISVWGFLGTPDFWFQWMQNWQSAFLAVGCLVVLSIFLRQHGSPQSKPVSAPDSQTGE
jgi:hypothetical protein